MKNLIYNSVEYNQFLIDEYGNIKNKNTDHIYKLSKSKIGYAVVYLPVGEKGKIKCIRVHKAVAETFLPNPENLPIVHHKDENKMNPELSNLEWVTYKKNTNYYLESISKLTPYYNNRKLTEKDVEFIRNNKNTYSYQQLADMFNVSKTTVINAYHGYTYN